MNFGFARLVDRFVDLTAAARVELCFRVVALVSCNLSESRVNLSWKPSRALRSRSVEGVQLLIDLVPSTTLSACPSVGIFMTAIFVAIVCD